MKLCYTRHKVLQVHRTKHEILLIKKLLPDTVILQRAFTSIYKMSLAELLVSYAIVVELCDNEKDPQQQGKVDSSSHNATVSC